MIRFFYLARTESGAQHEFDVEERDESTANTQAMIEVKRWLAEIEEPEERLFEFYLTHRTP